jgi:adenylate kinase
LGPQGAGKGTQAGALRELAGLVHVASGDVLRAAIREGTELGKRAKVYYDAGELVPDEITVGLLLEAIHRAGPGADVLLDGFPRTVAQARALDEALARGGERIDMVIELQLPLEVAKERLGGRLICRAHGHVYNVRTQPPKVLGVCDIDGSELYQRADDYPDAIEKRLHIWEREHAQLLEYYRPRELVRTVDADRPPDEVAADLAGLLRGSAAAT